LVMGRSVVRAASREAAEDLPPPGPEAELEAVAAFDAATLERF
jgi:hypothetical protein